MTLGFPGVEKSFNFEVLSAHAPELHVPVHPVRFVTAASLFDGHDAAINIMRRILQAQGAEVIHLGHNRSVDEVVAAAVQEDVQGVACQLVPGRPRRVLPATWSSGCARRAPATSGSTAAAAA